MSQNINLSGQKDQTLIFVSQEARQVDRNISSSASVVIFKDLGILQLEFDRPELRKLTIEASEMFSKISGDRRRWSYVYSPDSDFMGMLENELASFWSDGLSRIFGASVPHFPGASRTVIGTESAKALRAPARRGAKTDLGDRRAKAERLRKAGYSFGQIGNMMGISKSQAWKLLNRPD